MISYHFSTDHNSDAPTPLAFLAKVLIYIGIALVFAIPIAIFGIIYLLEPLLYKLFTKRVFIILVLSFVFINLLFSEEIYILSISILTYLIGILQSK